MSFQKPYAPKNKSGLANAWYLGSVKPDKLQHRVNAH